MNKDVAVKFDNVSKKFQKGRRLYIKQAITEIFRPQKKEDFWALKNLSFQIHKGETVGIIGANGSGKSTILKLIAGVMLPSKGSVEVFGRVGPLIELGAGFHPELTGRENIYLNGTILGLSKKEIDEKFDSIVAFSELADFIETPVKHYSSGMYIRLGFSLAIHTNPEILIIDEVLAVGDAAFQQKCLSAMQDFKKVGVTIILVSHNFSIIGEFCDKVFLIKEGRKYFEGDAEKAVLSYLKTTQKDTKTRLTQKTNNDGPVQISKIKFLDEKDREMNSFATGETMVIRIYYQVKEIIENPVIGIAIHRDDGVHITGPNTKTSKYQIKEIKGKGWIDYIIKRVPLLAGDYLLTAGIFNSSATFVYDFRDKAVSFRITPSEINQYGVIKFNEEWKMV